LLLLFLTFFRVSFDFRFSLPREAEVPDANQESLYDACYAEQDAEIHRTAFGTIDNPDVQKEFIISNRARAAAECRNAYPQKMITVAKPFQFNLVDVQPRFR
jgi:hypothetical protein